MRVFKSVFEAMPDGLVVVDAAGLIQYANEACLHLFGYTAHELAGQTIATLLPRDLVPVFPFPHTAASAIVPDGAAEGFSNLWVRRHNGDVLSIDIRLSALDLGGEPGTLCVIREATARKETEAQLHMADTVFQTTQEAIVVTDINNKILAVNPAFEKVTEYSAAEAIGQNIRILSSGRHDEYFYRQMWNAILASGQWQGSIWNRRKSGEVYQEWLSISTVRDRAGRPLQYIGVSADLSRMNHVETPIERLAHYDALTGLPNRLLFHSRAQKTWERAHRDQKPFAVMFLDLDGFKLINDTLGHAVGDELLKKVAERLRENLRGTDTIARFGGDEFVIVMEDPERADVMRIAQHLVEQIAQPFELGLPLPVQVGLSLGWSYYPEHADNVDTLLRQADHALYQVKRSGRGAWREYSGQ